MHGVEEGQAIAQRIGIDTGVQHQSKPECVCSQQDSGL